MENDQDRPVLQRVTTTPPFFTRLRRSNDFGRRMSLVDTLIEVLTVALNPQMEGRFIERFEPGWTDALVEVVPTGV